MINNFEKINRLLEFASEDDFYFMQILKRKKEHPDLGKNSLVIKTYYIKNQKDFEVKTEEAITIATTLNCRVYFDLNKRSFEQIAWQTLQKVTNQLMSKDYESIKSAYDTQCGMYTSAKSKKWIVDIDTKNEDYIQLVTEVIKLISNRYKSDTIFYTRLETKNGFHLITSGFNSDDFKLEMQLISMDVPDIQKNNPTLLFIP